MKLWCQFHFLATLTKKPLHRILGGSEAGLSVEVVLGIKPNLPRCLPITMTQLSQLKSHYCIVLLSAFNSPSDFTLAFSGVWRFIALCWNMYYWTFFLLAQQPPQWARASSFSRFLDHTQRRTTVGRTPLNEWSACRNKPIPYTTHHSQLNDIHAPSGIRTHNSSNGAAEHPRLRLRGHWDRHYGPYSAQYESSPYLPFRFF